jgi:hypothetical protein
MGDPVEYTREVTTPGTTPAIGQNSRRQVLGRSRSGEQENHVPSLSARRVYYKG